MITGSLITAADVEAEREVILDEIAMHDDDPDDVVHNLFAAQAWGDSPLGRPIAGTAASIASLSRDQVARFHKRHYRPANMVVAAAGNVDHTAVVRLVRRSFGRNGFLARDEAPVVPRTTAGRARKVHPGASSVTRPFEQVNLVLGVNGFTRHDDRRYALDCAKINALGWAPRQTFEEAMRETVEWYRDNQDWWRSIRGGEEYQAYYKSNYAHRLKDAAST